MGSCGLVSINQITARPSTQALIAADSIISNVSNKGDIAFATAIQLLNSLAQYIQIAQIDVDVDWEELTLPYLPGSIGALPVKPILDDVPSPALQFNYEEVLYISDLLNSLREKLRYYLLNDGPLITPEVETAIYDRESERDIRGLSDTMERIASRWAGFGFVLPDGILVSQMAWADIEYQNKKSDKSRKIAEDSLKIAIDNKRFIITESGTLENNLMIHNARANANRLVAATAVLDASIKLFEALLKKNHERVEIYTAEASAYEAQANAISAISGVEVAIYNARTHYNTDKANVSVKQIEMLIKQLELQTSVAIAIGQGVSSVAGHLAAGAMSAVNAGATISYGGQDSNSSSSQSSSSTSNQSSCSDHYIHNISE